MRTRQVRSRGDRACRSRVSNHCETFLSAWRREELIHFVDLPLGDGAEEHALRFHLISLSDSKLARRIVKAHIVQPMLGFRALEKRPHPLSVRDRVCGEVEDHGRAESQQVNGEGADDASEPGVRLRETVAVTS